MYAYKDFVKDLYKKEFANALAATHELLTTLNASASGDTASVKVLDKNKMFMIARDFRAVRGIFNRLLLCHDWLYQQTEEESCEKYFTELADNYIKIK